MKGPHTKQVNMIKSINEDKKDTLNHRTTKLILLNANPTTCLAVVSCVRNYII